MSYYERHKDTIIDYQMIYYRENRAKYLEYMKEYNRKYYMKHRPEPKPKKVKQPKPPKAPKEPKPPKAPKPPREKKLKEIKIDIKPKHPIITKGSFNLSFD